MTADELWQDILKDFWGENKKPQTATARKKFKKKVRKHRRMTSTPRELKQMRKARKRYLKSTAKRRRKMEKYD